MEEIEKDNLQIQNKQLSVQSRMESNIQPVSQNKKFLLQIQKNIPQKKSQRKINIYDDTQNFKVQQKLLQLRRNNSQNKNSNQIKAMDVENMVSQQPKQPDSQKINKQKNAVLPKKSVGVKIDQTPKVEAIKQSPIIHNINERKNEVVINQKVIKNHKVRIKQKLQDIIQTQQNDKNNGLTNKNSNIQSPMNEAHESYQSTKSLKSIKSVNDEDFDRVSRRTRQTFRSTRSSCQDYLGHVFDFYCKISYAMGKNPTFDQIQQKVKMMPITNFMIFCKDFKIRDQMERHKLVQLFRKYSSFQKYLTPEQFHTLVQNMAQILFSQFQQERRFGRMLVFLEIHNSFSFVRKMNKLGVSFRLKNKRGEQVNLAPRYTFKLTPNNGKDQQQIKLQVKQKSILRKMLKEQQMQWHKKNKLNKIDQLYKNGAKNKKKKKEKVESSKSKTNNDKYSFKQNSIGKIVPNIGNYHNQIKQSQQNKLEKAGCGGYYNPCEILTQRTENTYKNIHQLKKKMLQKQPSDRTFNQSTSYNSIPSKMRELRVNNIISMAKNTIIQQENYNSQNYSPILSRLTKTRKYKQVGTIIKQNVNRLNNSSIDSISALENQYESTDSRFINQRLLGKLIRNNNIIYVPRLSKQIRAEQMIVQSQIKNMPLTLFDRQVKPKQFLRATAKVDRQNTKQIHQLQQMIGVNDQEQDKILEKHFQMENQYEKNLSKLYENK